MKTIPENSEIIVGLQNVPKTPRADDKFKIDYLDTDIAIVDKIYALPDASSVKLDVIMFLICSKGCIQLDVNDKTYIVHENEMIFCGHYKVVSNFMVSLNFEGKCLMLSYSYMYHMLHADRDVMDRLYYYEQNPVLPIVEKEYELFNDIYKMRQTFLDNTCIYRKEILTAFLQSMLYMLLSKLNNVPLANTKNLYQADLIFRNFKELLAKGNGEHRLVAYYANELCVSSKYLTVVCKKLCGHTASEMIRDCTIDHIRRLLKDTSKPIKDIVYELDFPNISFFGKFVRKHLGVSPANYRKNPTD